MREIKFRAWDKNLKKWCHGNDARGFNLFGEALLIGGILHDSYYSHNVFERLFADVEVMQFTGLKDKNGKEIWEGDIVSYLSIDIVNGMEARTPKLGAVEWSDGSFSFNEISTLRQFSAHRFQIEVIGNIYENPELLKGGSSGE